jgi:hypothetical protein
MTDNVNHPAHYGKGADDPYEHIRIMENTLTPDEFVGAMKFNISKYMHRERMKNGIEDLPKDQWYMNRLVEYLTAQKLRMNIKDIKTPQPVPWAHS